MKSTLRLLKTNKNFYKGLNDILGKFGSEIAETSVSAQKEMILMKYPVIIDRIWTQLQKKKEELHRKRIDPSSSSLTEEEIMNGTDETNLRPGMVTDKKTGKKKKGMVRVKANPGINDLTPQYEKLKERYDEAQASIDDNMAECESIEEYFSEKLVNYIRSAAQTVKTELLDEYEDELKAASTEATVTPIVIHSFDDLEQALEDKATAEDVDPVQDVLNKIAVLDNLINVSDTQSNIIEGFLKLYAENYIQAKDHLYHKLPEGTEAINKLFNRIKENLPLFKLKDFIQRVREDAPIQMPKARGISKVKEANTISSLLASIDPGDLETRKGEIVDAINSLDIDELRKNAAIGILNNPRETPAKIITKLKGMLGGIARDAYKGPTGANIDINDITFGEATFNDVVRRILTEKKSSKCTKVTGQTTSTRSDKKYMRCAKVDGKLKRVHYGDPNLRIKKSNPKKRKSFRARHKCSTAKPGTPKYYSCKNWLIGGLLAPAALLLSNLCGAFCV
jgi:hypothetical protein